MLRPTIEFNKADLARLTRAINAVSETVKAEGAPSGNVARRCSIEMVNVLRKNIMSNKFAAMYTSGYSKHYEEWKRNNTKATSQGYWRLYDDVVRNLTFFKPKGTGGGWAAGIPAGVMDSGGKSWKGYSKGYPKPIAAYAKIVEEGSKNPMYKNFPARPMFAPSGLMYVSSGRFSLQAQKSLRIIKSKWR